ncbi:probable E3 ubiquitin-protein ligase HERC4 [Antedon mediterranea]|uniref:probable E3 ubiquitin-protein ligase HERC4 n=1 Tax=Antedon mediterranea TaxID=105859 RepID=UPI003AF7B03F
MTSSRVFCLNPVKHDQNAAAATSPVIKELQILNNRSIQQIACSNHQTIFVLTDGTVYTCENEEKSTPDHVSSLDTFVIVQAACGDTHNIVISDKGQIISWGRDSEGQCGHGEVHLKKRTTPKVIKSLSNEVIIQVACGAKHTLALAKSGKLYAWGDNSYWQLGYSTTQDHCAIPTHVSCLAGLPIQQISCGGNHSLVLTFNGNVFGWGCNNSNQLGEYDEKSCKAYIDTTEKQLPKLPAFQAVKTEKDTVLVGGVSKLIETHLQAVSGMPEHRNKSFEELRHEFNFISASTVPHKLDFLKQITSISCGHNFSVFLSKNGEVVRLAKDLNQTWNENIAEIHKEKDKTIVCTKWHSVILTGDKLYVFGLTSMHDPHSAVSNDDDSSMFVYDSLSRCITDATGTPDTVNISNVYCGGLNTCYLVTNGSVSKKKSISGRNNQLPEMIYHLDKGVITELEPLTSANLKLIQNIFSSAECLNNAFTSDRLCNEDSSGLDLSKARKALKMLSEKHIVLKKIDHAISSQLCPTLLTSPLDVEALCVYMILLECPTMQCPEFYLKSILAVAEALCNLSPKMSKVIDTWIGNFSPPTFQHLLSIFKNVVVHLVMKQLSAVMTLIFTDEMNISIPLNMLKKLYKINEEMEEIVPYAAFYIPKSKNLLMWLNMNMLSPCLNLIDYPFVLENDVKMNSIIQDNILQQQAAMDEQIQLQIFQQLAFTPMFSMHMHPAFQHLLHLRITIERENIVGSALEQLRSVLKEDFKKPLKIQFDGEPGVDDGGPCKEFFLLIFKEILDPKFGMFKVFSKTERIWFNPQSFEDNSVFEMVGILCGLAIYNQVIVELPFPLALYKKLLNKPVFLSDLTQLDPDMTSSLENILDYDDCDLQDVFGIFFQFSSEFLGDVCTIELKEGGKDIPVTYENKQEFVDLYIDCMFNESIKEQYSAFAEGFHQVCGGPILQMFHPEELMSLVIGNEIYDWEEFESLVEYKGLYNKEHKTIKYFWEVFHELTLKEKKKFLEFLTGSDRIPVQGMSQLKVIFQPVFGSTDFLPAAHTCYNYLDLPIYESKEKMREKLMMALEHAHGFGLL